MAAGQRPTRRSVENTGNPSPGQRDRSTGYVQTETQGIYCRYCFSYDTQYKAIKATKSKSASMVFAENRIIVDRFSSSPHFPFLFPNCLTESDSLILNLLTFSVRVSYLNVFNSRVFGPIIFPAFLLLIIHPENMHSYSLCKTRLTRIFPSRTSEPSRSLYFPYNFSASSTCPFVLVGFILAVGC